MTTTVKPVLEKDPLDGIDPKRWGLSLEAVQSLGHQLFDCWDRFHDCFTTRTRNTSPLAHVYLKGLLLLPEERNYANIARRIIGPDDDGSGVAAVHVRLSLAYPSRLCSDPT